MLTVTKQAAGEGKSGITHPATLERGKLVTVAIMWKAPPEGGGALLHANCK
jgi:hypothetical protein